MDPEEAISVLNKKGFGCIFTEHVDYNPQGEPYFCTDLDAYFRDYIKHKSNTVRLGLEIGLIAECVDINRAHASHETLDYVIGSVHCTDGWDIYLCPDYFTEAGEEMYKRHLSYMLKMVQINDFFDALGHIDYISRYSPFSEKNVLYETYADEYDAILRTLIEQDKLLELSTKRLGDEKARKNLVSIYSRYRDLGGQYVTIGSDAHDTRSLGYNFDIALEMINEIGLMPVYFKNRRRILCTQTSA